MLKVDFRRMFKSKLFYILISCALVMPILMTIMMAMMDGSVSVNPQTGVETVMQGPENTWQNIGTLPGGEAMGGNEVFMMCTSTTFSGFICGTFMLLAYFVGSMLGGAIAGLSFDLHGLTAGNLAMCMIAKIFLMPVFIAIFVLISVAAKHKAWLALCGSLGGGMLLFMMVSIITPLGATFLNVILCLVGGALFAVVLGATSNVILKKTSLV